MFQAREASDSIKPGAPAPGSRIRKHDRARRAGDSGDHYTLSPAPRAPSLFSDLILGLAPQALRFHLLRRLKHSTASQARTIRRLKLKRASLAARGDAQAGAIRHSLIS